MDKNAGVWCAPKQAYMSLLEPQGGICLSMCVNVDVSQSDFSGAQL